MNYKSQPADRLLRVHTAARMLGCSPRTVRRRIQNHEIPATRTGCRAAWVIRARDLYRRMDYGRGHP
jgi:excisionase family DNA binding protein